MSLDIAPRHINYIRTKTGREYQKVQGAYMDAFEVVTYDSEEETNAIGVHNRGAGLSFHAEGREYWVPLDEVEVLGRDE